MEQKLYFQKSNGVKLCGLLSRPDQFKKKLLIIFIHGFTSNKNTTNFVKLVKILSQHKIPSFRFDLFGHGESGGKIEEITVSEAVDDVLSAIKSAKKLGFNNIGLVGSSFGGLASIVASSLFKEVKFLVLKSPVVNLLEKEILTKSEKEINDWKQKGFRYYYTSEGRKLKINFSFFEDAGRYDGYQIAKKINIPILIVHGDKDQTVPVSQSIKFSKITPNSQLVLIKNADHRYTNKRHAKKMIDTISKFIIENSRQS